MTFLSEASEALFCFLLFSGFRGPLRKNLFTQGGNDFWQGSFFIIWLFLSEASEALLFFSGFRGPFSTNLFTPGGNDFRQGSFFILCFFCPPRLLRPFCLGGTILLLRLYIAIVFVWLRNEENCLWLTLVESDWSSWVAPSLLKAKSCDHLNNHEPRTKSQF